MFEEEAEATDLPEFPRSVVTRVLRHLMVW